MAWSTTYRWGGYSETDAQGLINHDVREPGVTQSNEGVDPSRTHLNTLRIWDPETGEERAVRTGESAAATVRRRLRAVLDASTPDTVRQQKMAPVLNVEGNVVRNEKGRPKIKGTGEYVEKVKARRKDASVMLEFVLQLDGDFTGTGYLFDEEGDPIWERDENGDPRRDEKGYRIQAKRTCADMSEAEREEAERLLEAMIQETWEQFPTGQKLYAAIHWDEMHPHAQVALVPTLEDGRVNATVLLAGGKARDKTQTQNAYAARHDAMRARLLSEGYEATFERLDGPKRHVGLTAHKKGQEAARRESSQRADEREALARQAQEQQHRANAQSFRGRLLDETSEELDARERELEDREAALDARARDLDLREEKLREQGEQVRAAARQTAIQRRAVEADGRALGRVHATAAERVLWAAGVRGSDAWKALEKELLVGAAADSPAEWVRQRREREEARNRVFDAADAEERRQAAARRSLEAAQARYADYERHQKESEGDYGD